jgi:hypothetical protein
LNEGMGGGREVWHRWMTMARRYVLSGSLSRVEMGLGARRSQFPGRKSAIEGILYALTELLPLLRGIIVISYGPTTFHDPLLETFGRPADAALRGAQTDHSRAVRRVMLLVPDELQRHCPWPGYGHKREAPRVEDRLWAHSLWPQRIVEDRIVWPSLLTANVGTTKNTHKRTPHTGI